MEVIKRKILLENSVDRTYNSPTWGVLTATSFFINVLITQSIDDMGIFTDIEYIPKSEILNTTPDYTILSNKLSSMGIIFPFMLGNTISVITGSTINIIRGVNYTESDYYLYGNLKISGFTNSKIEDVKSYNNQTPYIPGFDIVKNNYINYNNLEISGVSRVVSLNNPNTYVFDTKNDIYIGTSAQTYGLLYNDYIDETREVIINDIKERIGTTKVSYVGEGWNETNVSLSALTKQEYLFGIISTPKVQSDVFIDRGITTVMERHLKLSEIKNLGELERYGNGFFILRKQ